MSFYWRKSSLWLATTAIQTYPIFSRNLIRPILGNAIRYICFNQKFELKLQTMSKRYSTESDDIHVGADSSASKKTKVSVDELFSLSDSKKISVALIKGLWPLVNIREYYKADSGEEKPGKKGIALRANQWNTLRDMIPRIDAHLLPVAEKSEEFVQNIDEKLRVTLSNYKGKQLVQVRETYVDQSGETRFGAKGIALSLNEWKELCNHSEAIDAALTNMGAVKASSSSNSTGTDAKTTTAGPEDSFSLGNLRKVSVNMFKDKVLVNIREFYQREEGGGELPGKKGIALTPQQWEELEKVRFQLEEGKSFPIGNKRQVTCAVFHGKKLYNLREFYDDKITGEEKPGNKGIALSESQWEQLNKQWEDINASIRKLVAH